MFAGSGKTLAYVVPLVSRLRDEEELHGLLARQRRPRALIVLPSRDLAAQVLVGGNVLSRTVLAVKENGVSNSVCVHVCVFIHWLKLGSGQVIVSHC